MPSLLGGTGTWFFLGAGLASPASSWSSEALSSSPRVARLALGEPSRSSPERFEPEAVPQMGPPPIICCIMAGSMVAASILGEASPPLLPEFLLSMVA